MSPGKALILLGAVLMGVGLLVLIADKLPFKPGQLPGDFVYRGRNTTIYLPLTTSLLASVLLTLLFWLFSRK